MINIIGWLSGTALLGVFFLMSYANVEDLHIERKRPDRVRIRILLAEKGWSVSLLARKIKAPVSSTHEAVKGGRYTSSLLPRIAKALGVSLDTILLKTDKEEAQAA